MMNSEAEILRSFIIFHISSYCEPLYNSIGFYKDDFNLLLIFCANSNDNYY